ncbi:MAG: bifunctional aspartate kinase/homoserine dehydrogenase I [Wenzhouxiangellaceae bacterium]
MGWVVHKFGGSSLADAEAFRHVCRLLASMDDEPQAVVVSAMQGVTDALIEAAHAAAAVAGHAGPDWVQGYEALRQRHLECADALELAPDVRATLVQSFGELKHLLEGLALLGSLPHEVLDLVSGLGEQWSARILSGVLRREGLAADFVDARDVIRIERGELGPVPLMDASRRALAGLGLDRSARIVMTGFSCREASGRVTTLGRNGSDFSATILAALLDAGAVHIWTDVDGVLSADPGRVPQAEVVQRLSYREAFELAYFGASVLHPQTLAPLLQRAIPVRIRSTRKPDLPGTLIDRSGSDTPPVKGVSCVGRLALINIEGAGMLGVPGTAERVFETLHRAEISVTMISQGSSEHSICCVLPRDDAERARELLNLRFMHEIESAQLQRISVLDDIEVLAIVGDGMAGSPGVAGRLFSALGRADINVRAIAQGSSERNISVAVDAAAATRALRVVHSAFYLSDQTISIGLIGPGQVGRALLGQIRDAGKKLMKAQRIDLRVRAVADSSSMELAEREVSAAGFEGRLDQAMPADLDRFADHVHPGHLPQAVIIDCSASEAIADRYAGWLERGIHVITPNKHAGSGDLARYMRLRELTKQGGARWRYEATVGAGLPIIQTLRDQLDSGDRVLTIEGIFSGTLAWLFNRFRAGMSFADLVREARSSGYTEPDPRDDLSGTDVARKLVILAREIGLELSLDQVEVENLVPDGLDAGGVDEFLAALDVLDAGMSERIERADAADQCLRYTASLDADGHARVGLEALPQDHPFAHLALTDNVIAFTTERYRENPLIVRGPGAGPQVTAAGVFSDLLRIAQSR